MNASCKDSILDKVKKERAERILTTENEFKALVSSYCATTREDSVQDLEEFLRKRLISNKLLLHNLTRTPFPNTTFSFRTNKNPEILTEALRILETHGMPKCSTLQQHFDKPYLGEAWSYYIRTSGAFAAVQSILLHTISLVKDSTRIEDLVIPIAEISYPYHVDYSPAVQGISLPKVAMRHPLYNELTQSLYFYKDHLSPEQGEMLALHNGYFYGGSREDTRYLDKNLRAEDCSSAISKWLESPAAFATSHMKNSFNHNCNQEQFCNAVSKVLEPLEEPLENVAPGDIFVFKQGAHTGIVESIINDSCFTSLSYSRDIPRIDGLIEREECLTEREYLFFTPLCSSSDEL